MIWFASDHHYCHKNIITYAQRPFANLDEMEAALIANHNALVAPDDTVYFVGDFALGDRKVSVPIVQQLNGNITLIAGNHDDCFQVRSKAVKAREFYIESGFVDVVHGLELTLSDGTEVLVDHFPYKGDHTIEERFSELRPRDDGKWLIHGHVHNLWTVRERQINVGVDAWNFRPISENTILSIIRAVECGYG